jgi:hypothetical protein
VIFIKTPVIINNSLEGNFRLNMLVTTPTLQEQEIKILSCGKEIHYQFMNTQALSENCMSMEQFFLK